MFIIFAEILIDFDMSPRRKRMRKIFGPPAIKGFRPQRRGGGSIDKVPVILLLEEYEAIKLCDYDLMNHLEASEIMGVSRPTFTRIYASARQKIAQALVEVKEIVVEGGKVYYDSEWFECDDCSCNFNHQELSSKPGACPLCGGSNIRNFSGESGDDNECYCSECGEKFFFPEDTDCASIVCPACGERVCSSNKKVI
jgi:predicted DNA-binding protein (UPF0251 family)